MNLVFVDSQPIRLYPFTLTRPASEIRIGILTIREKWLHYLKCNYCWLTENYLQVKYPFTLRGQEVYINGSLLPDEPLIRAVEQLKPGQKLISKDHWLACYPEQEKFSADVMEKLQPVEYTQPVTLLEHLWQIFLLNDSELRKDFIRITTGRKSSTVSRLSHPDLFIEEEARIADCFINTSNGPVYVGREAEIMEGCMIRGPVALCQGAVLKMGAKVYGATTLGPYAKAGGELNNVVIFGFSNKAHDGFLGNAVIGEWCNLGADTNNSNLKNNYGKVKVWSYLHGRMIDSGLQFCGLFMGDHSKCGINTMFNTGTVVGVSANLFGGDFLPKFIPSFSWGGVQRFERYRLNDALQAAAAMYERRNQPFTAADQSILSSIYSMEHV
jgi:UDP-N-acetylglucosamine diphosphorylase/glucosamine-1-phosphate N-acetyltransferase